MPSLQTLLLFIVATSGLLLSPGPNMALVVSQGLAYGSRGGLAVALGIAIADLVLTLLVVVGVAALLAAWPAAIDGLRYLGAAYLLRLAWLALRRRHGGALPDAAARSTRAIVEVAVLTSLLNPKALLFFLLFLPQFVEAGSGPVGLQLAALGVMLTGLAFVFHGALGVASAKARRFATGGGDAVVWLDRLQAVVFVGLALRLVFVETRVAG